MKRMKASLAVLCALILGFPFAGVHAQNSSCVMNDYTFYPIPNTPRPAKGVTFQDTVFHTNITRITDASADLGTNYIDPGYSKHDIENADGTMLFLQSYKYPGWHIWNANPPYNHIKDLPASITQDIDPDIRWDATDPNILYSTFSSKMYKYNVVTDEITLLHDFQPDFPSKPIARVFTAEEGDSSADSRYWAFRVRCSDANHSPTWWDTALIVYDKDYYGKDNGKIISTLNEGSPLFYQAVNFADISFDGNWVWCTEPGVIYPRNLSSRRTVPISGHADRGISAEGRQVIFGAKQRWSVDGYTDMGIWTTMFDMETGEVTWLSKQAKGAGYYHISANSVNKPGWGLVSSYGPQYPTVPTTWDEQTSYLVELTTRTDPPPRVWRLHHTHTIYTIYGSEPFAKINKKGTKVFFASGWGQAFQAPGGQYDVYQIDLPQECFNYFPPAPNCTIQGGDCSATSCCSGLYCGSSLTCQNCLTSETGKCTNGIDDDCDGLKDCNDPDCSSDPACIACSNQGASCASSSCCSGLYCDSSKLCQNCLSSEAGKCSNGIDDNCNGQTDCSDANCYSDASCCKTSGQSCTSGTCCSGLTCQSAALGIPTATASADKLSGPVPLIDQFYGSGTDTDGSITSYLWNWGDSFMALSQNPSKNYAYPGNYKAVFAVKDNNNFTGSTYLDIQVTGGTSNPPTATASASPASGPAPLTVSFTGSGTDTDGTIAFYYWNFGYDQFSTSSSQNPVYTYNKPGSYIATLMAMDNSSAFGNAIVNITVTGSNAVCTTGGCLKAEISPCNGCVEMGELTSFIDRWKVSNLDVTLKDMIEAIGLWKKGCS